MTGTRLPFTYRAKSVSAAICAFAGAVILPRWNFLRKHKYKSGAFSRSRAQILDDFSMDIFTDLSVVGDIGKRLTGNIVAPEKTILPVSACLFAADDGVFHREIFHMPEVKSPRNSRIGEIIPDRIRFGDTVIVVECSRLHRSCSGLESIYREIVENKGCEFVTLDEKEKILCTNGANDDLMQMSMKKIILTVLGTVAEMEKKNIGARTKRALAERKAKGVKLGRPAVELPPKFKELYKQACRGEITHVQAMQELGLKKTSYYKLAKSLK